MMQPDSSRAEIENRHHHYVGYRIPWYVHLLWVLFWVFAVVYVLRYLFPEIRKEFRKPGARQASSLFDNSAGRVDSRRSFAAWFGFQQATGTPPRLEPVLIDA
jgi:hypothetical protein